MAGASADPRGICVSDGKVAPNGRSACTEHASHLSSYADPHGSVVVECNDLPSDHALAVVHDSLDALIVIYQRRRETLSGVGYGRSRISIALWTVAADGEPLP